MVWSTTEGFMNSDVHCEIVHLHIIINAVELDTVVNKLDRLLFVQWLWPRGCCTSDSVSRTSQCRKTAMWCSGTGCSTSESHLQKSSWQRRHTAYNVTQVTLYSMAARLKNCFLCLCGIGILFLSCPVICPSSFPSCAEYIYFTLQEYCMDFAEICRS